MRRTDAGWRAGAALSVALLAAAGDGWVRPAGAAPVPKETEAAAKKMEELWAMLLDRDEAVGSRGLLGLAARPPGEVVPFLAGKLRPLELSGERARALVADLDKDEAVAAAAARELRYLDPRLALDVGDLLTALPDGRHRQRVVALLVGAELDAYAGCKVAFESAAGLKARLGVEGLGTFVVERPDRPRGEVHAVGVPERVADLTRWQWHPEWARATRAVVLLEHLGTPAAVKALEAMAAGHPDAAPTAAAKRAVERLKGK